MKATELQIGDLVLWTYENGQLYSFPIIKLGEEHISCSPILLTETILEANKFKCINEECCWYQIKDNIIYDYEHESLSYLINDICWPICNITYVHQLQHVLRLFDLNELAYNFKV